MGESDFLLFHLHVLPRLIMRGAIPPVTHVFMAWYVRLKDFTSTCHQMLTIS
jgi:hypothetical protein